MSALAALIELPHRRFRVAGSARNGGVRDEFRSGGRVRFLRRPRHRRVKPMSAGSPFRRLARAGPATRPASMSSTLSLSQRLQIVAACARSAASLGARYSVLPGDLGDQDLGDRGAVASPRARRRAAPTSGRRSCCPVVKCPSKPPELAWRNITLRKLSRSRGCTASTACAPSTSVATDSDTHDHGDDLLAGEDRDDEGLLQRHVGRLALDLGLVVRRPARTGRRRLGGAAGRLGLLRAGRRGLGAGRRLLRRRLERDAGADAGPEAERAR